MDDVQPVILAKEGVSDDSFLFLEELKSEGELAEAGECIARLETSKATVDVNSPCRGHVFYRFRKGQEIPVGGILAVISPEGSRPAESPEGARWEQPKAGPASDAQRTLETPAPDRTRVTPLARKMMESHHLTQDAFIGVSRIDKASVEAALRNQATQRINPRGPTRFSKAAEERIRALGLSPSAFDGRGLITAADVLSFAEREKTAPSAPTAAAAPAPLPEGAKRKPLSKSKKNEILFLREGQKDALPSAISILVAARGLFDEATGSATPLLLPILVYESARLLSAFPELNGYYEDGALVEYPSVDIGVAFEIDSGLKVPIIRGADGLGVPGIRAALDAFVLRYLENTLSVEDLSGGTFTITDLSNEKVFGFLPLINRKQSAILGMGDRYAFGTESAAFPLTLAFDHRVSTGRRASQFLRGLKERLESYGPVLDPRNDPVAPEQKSCSQCRNRESDLISGQYLLSIQKNGRADWLCSACLAGW